MDTARDIIEAIIDADTLALPGRFSTPVSGSDDVALTEMDFGPGTVYRYQIIVTRFEIIATRFER